MKAPTKIFIHPDIGNKDFIRPWLHNAASDESVEYINKKLLLNWADERYLAYDSMPQTQFFVGQKAAMKELIEKIESL